MIEAEYQRKNKSEQNQMREDYERSKGLKTCEFLLRSVFEFGMDHIKNLKVKELRMLLHYHFRSEKLKSSPNKVELVEAVNDFLERIRRVLFRWRGWDICCNKKYCHEASGDIVERYIFLL